MTTLTIEEIMEAIKKALPSGRAFKVCINGYSYGRPYSGAYRCLNIRFDKKRKVWQVEIEELLYSGGFPYPDMKGEVSQEEKRTGEISAPAYLIEYSHEHTGAGDRFGCEIYLLSEDGEKKYIGGGNYDYTLQGCPVCGHPECETWGESCEEALSLAYEIEKILPKIPHL